ncbi:hypothetical protein HO173_011026 [Letharia columbiana]|uniref:Uncharacterized protein n=1 Tax=Letharia columbiana TaxID=112416 RepID=A0A8H6FLG8_9LECA|nr:uncharacterized protein HO173_011026 [Letharia columbiana]KAF6230675.1 hypothetical protein HO173_011026 [Letharia columbiana]
MSRSQAMTTPYVYSTTVSSDTIKIHPRLTHHQHPLIRSSRSLMNTTKRIVTLRITRMTTVPSLAKMAGQTPSEISNHREAMPDRAQTLRLFASYIRIPGKYESGLKKSGESRRKIGL